ncbi:MAG: amino acid ABC transporter substrate-binding protein [Rhodospirillales bacterium]
MRLFAALCLGCGLAGPAAVAAETKGPVIPSIMAEGHLRCGVIRNSAGIADTDDAGKWHGFFPDLCRAAAAALVGRADGVDFVELSAETRFDAVRDGVVHVLMANSTLTLGRDADGLEFPTVALYDGQGFMAPASKGWTKLAEVDNARVCVIRGTTTIGNLTDLIAEAKPGLKTLEMASHDGLFEAFFSRRCDLVTTDRVILAAHRSFRAASPADFVIFPDVISKEPLAPVVSEDSDDLAEAFRWIIWALLEAEELKVTGATARALKSRPPTKAVSRLLDSSGELKPPAGLEPGWALRAIEAVGNYGEVFARNLGNQSPIGLERGQNALWKDGGLMYAPPFR